MNPITKALKRVRVVYRKSNTLTKTVVLSTIVPSMAALLALNLSIQAAQLRAQELANQAAQLEQENQQLENNIDDLGSADSVEQIAKDELGLVNPDIVVIDPQE